MATALPRGSNRCPAAGSSSIWALYPALMRLEQRGLLRGKWGVTETNRKARYYDLTAAGRRQLAREKQAWNEMAGIIQSLLQGRS
jgi:DNA-binding PadR family transcriptional regulator